MSENVTFEAVAEEALEIQDDLGLNEFEDYQQSILQHANLITMFYKCYYPLQIVIGFPGNILALLILIRRRLWLHHEAYIYLAAVLIVNAVTLVVVVGDHCLEIFDHELVRLSLSADIICKLWEWIFHFYSYSNWLHVLMLLNVYLRRQLATSNDRRGCYMNLAANYCTLFGTKVVVGSVFTVFVAANFWLLSFSSLERVYRSTSWRCSYNDLHLMQYILLTRSLHWTETISLAIVLLLILLAVCRRWKSTGFSQMNGATNDYGETEVTARIAVLCSVVIFTLKVTKVFNLVVFVFQLWPRFGVTFYRVIFAVDVISVAYPLSMPIVCFAVKSSFRDELRAIVNRCWCFPGARHHRTLPLVADSDRNSVLEMDPINEDNTRREL